MQVSCQICRVKAMPRKLILERRYQKGGHCTSLVTVHPSSRYIPHGVYHLETKTFRVVMDCSAEFNRCSLITELLQAPDTTNNLIGVLVRFRIHLVPFMGTMFYVLSGHHTGASKKLSEILVVAWWRPGKDLSDYEMYVHLFMAISSASCAGFALR